ncbi:MAG: nucleotidyltransferase family protein [bacterium]
MDAVVLAGGIPGPEDPLYNYTQGQSKALVDIAGAPMVQWVLNALGRAISIDHVLVVGLDQDCGLTCAKPSHFLSDQGHMLDNIKAGLRHNNQRNPSANRVIVASSDIPTITPEIVDWRVHKSLEHECDIDYAVVDRKTMETRFPGANRSYIRLKDYELCGGDLNVIRVALIEKEQLYRRLIAARKNALKQCAMLGIDLLLLLLLGRLSLKDAEHRACERIGVKGRACLSPYAELAMDVDKPHQLELVRQDLTNRGTPIP